MYSSAAEVNPISFFIPGFDLRCCEKVFTPTSSLCATPGPSCARKFLFLKVFLFLKGFRVSLVLACVMLVTVVRTLSTGVLAEHLSSSWFPVVAPVYCIQVLGFRDVL